MKGAFNVPSIDIVLDLSMCTYEREKKIIYNFIYHILYRWTLKQSSLCQSLLDTIDASVYHVIRIYLMIILMMIV